MIINRILLPCSALLCLATSLCALPAQRPPAAPPDALDEEEPAARPTTLPLQFDYKGREADAPWRKEAQARIDKFRKADLSIVVNDATGKPVSGADVSIKMKRHAFSWGAATRIPLVVEKSTLKLGPGLSTPDKSALNKYQEILPSLFNRSGLIN